MILGGLFSLLMLWFVSVSSALFWMMVGFVDDVMILWVWVIGMLIWMFGLKVFICLLSMCEVWVFRLVCGLSLRW